MGARAAPAVVVIGGGVAGIAAAVALADEGCRVTLVEKRPLLGGRASSWIEHGTGERLDACQHGTMRCCTNLASLLERLGVHDRIRYHSEIPFLDRDGRRSSIRGSFLPAPLHTAPSFLLFRSLGWRDKLGVARAFSAILGTRPSEVWERTPFSAWLERMSQTRRSVHRFYEPVLWSACNETLDRISCASAFMILRDGFLANNRAFEFGIPSVPLGTLYTEPAERYLAERGGQVRRRATVSEIRFRDGAIQKVVLQSGEALEADWFVSAVQFDLLLKLVPETVQGDSAFWDGIGRLEVSPIVGIHLWFDREIECPECLAVLDRRSQWIFNKTRNFGLPGEAGTYLSVVISADRELTAMSAERILQIVIEDVRECLPEARQARLLKSYVLKERKATFSPFPGADALRPDQQSPVSNLFVAGEWTRTGWPSTMESAARSGFLAAEKLLAKLGRPRSLLAPNLPPNGLARLFRACRGWRTEAR